MPHGPSHPRSRAHLAVGTLLLIALAGCMGRGSGTGPDPFRGADENSIALQLENLSDVDINVSALSSTRRHSLGVVRARSTVRIGLPWRDRDFLRFQIEPTGESPHTTTSVSIEAGEALQLFLQVPASRSTVRR